MKLQKMISAECTDTEIILVTEVHAINGAQDCDNFTLCGMTIPDSDLRIESYEPVGKVYKGNLNDVDCPQCLKVINFCKQLE